MGRKVLYTFLRSSAELRKSAVLVLLATFAFSEPTLAAGLPLRTEAPTTVDRKLEILIESIEFKLAHLIEVPPRAVPRNTWVALVNDAVMLADHLEFPAEARVQADRIEDTYMITLEGEGFVAGYDPDLVLGRFLYMLAHYEFPSPARGFDVLDRRMSLTLDDLATSATSIR